jgi:hypothetical protein
MLKVLQEYRYYGVNTLILLIIITALVFWFRNYYTTVQHITSHQIMHFREVVYIRTIINFIHAIFHTSIMFPVT